MINPAEEIVNIWLQEVHNHFTMSNIVIHKKTRLINGRKIGGGRGKEVDFLSTDGKKYYWIEVSVSPNPRLSNKVVRLRESVNSAVNKFATEKEIAIQSRFGYKKFEKWFVYSSKLFPKKSKEETFYCQALQKRNIKAISFEYVLKDIFNKLDYMGYDTPRQYLFLLKKFGYKYQE